MTKAFANQIQHQHKPILPRLGQMDAIEDGLDWAFRKLEGPAIEADTEIVQQMRAIALDPEAWEAYGLPSNKREEALAVCDEWLKEIGVESVVHLEYE